MSYLFYCTHNQMCVPQYLVSITLSMVSTFTLPSSVPQIIPILILLQMLSKNKTPVVFCWCVTGPCFLFRKIIHIPSMVTVHTVQVVQYDLRVSQMAPNCLLLAESLGFAEHTVVTFVWNGLKNIRPAGTQISMCFSSNE